MKRKIFALLLLVCISVLALASCEMLEGLMGGEKECEHTFSTTWSADAKNHWYAATCEHGENKGSLGEHADADEDGKCDVCEFEVGHECTYAEEWTIDEAAQKHWHAATCSHTDNKGDEGLHKDDNTDGVCDICNGHVHILNALGFCEGCDKEIKPVVETDLGAVVAATTARVDKVISGSVEMTYTGHSNHENSDQFMWHKQFYTLGTNGTYTNRIVNQVGTDGVATGKQEVIHRWIPYGTDETILGISATSVDGVYIDAYPTAYGPNDLAGYYYAVSALANEFGAEATLYAVYQTSLLDTASNFTYTHDAEANSYTFSFDVFLVNASHMSDDTTVYNVNFYEVEAAFSYADDYTLTAMTLGVTCYTSDPGGDFGGTWVEDIDLDYDPDTGVMTIRKGDLTKMYFNGKAYSLTKKSAGDAPFSGVYTAVDADDNTFEVTVTADTISFTPTGGELQSFGFKYENSTLSIIDTEPSVLTFDYNHPAYGDKYVFTTTQTKGTREEIEISDGSEFTPDGVGLFADEAHTTLAESIEVFVGDYSRELYVGVVGEGGFISFVKNYITITVTDKNGNKTSGLVAPLVGDVVQIHAYAVGEYKITFTALDETVEIPVKIKEIPVKGESKFTVTVTETYNWDQKYTFTAEKMGYYIFYIGANLGVATPKTNGNNTVVTVDFDYQSEGYDPTEDHILSAGYDKTQNAHKGIFLVPGMTFEFYYSAAAKGDYEVGYTYSTAMYPEK